MNRLLPTTPVFENVSIIIAAINETASLHKTVEILYETCKLSDLKEIILVVSKKKSTPDCIKVGEDLQREAKVPFHLLFQARPFAGGAYQDAFDQARGSHVIMMASDLETDPNDVQKLIAESKQYPNAIICGSRWLGEAGFKGYSRAKYAANYVFQQIMKVMYGAGLTDWTFAYRLYPRSVVNSIKWEEMRHPFFLETVLKPLSLGVQTREIPSTWSRREEGASQNPFWINFLYFKTAVKIRLALKESLLREKSEPSKAA